MSELIDPWIYVRNFTLQGYQELDIAADFSDDFWLVNETEHGSDSPERLHGFDAFPSHRSRTDDIDRDLLIPYFIRYLWEVPYPLYTRQAWWLLETLVGDAERLEAVARSILAQHPHGDLRAAVLQWRADWGFPIYLQTEAFFPLLAQRVRLDPHPAVRAAAVQLVMHVSRFELDNIPRGCEIALPALDDANPEVRAAAFAALADSGRDQVGVRAALRAALQRPDNAVVLDAMLTAICSDWLGGDEADGIAATLNAIAAQRDHPLFPDFCRRIAWWVRGGDDIDGPVLKCLLPATPFENGAALTARVESVFADPAADLETRAAMFAIIGKRARGIDAPQALAFLLNEPHTSRSLEQGSAAYAVWHNLFPAAHRAGENVIALFERLHSLALTERTDDSAAYAPKYCSMLFENAIRFSLTAALPAKAAQALLDRALGAAAEHPNLTSSPFYPIKSDVEVPRDFTRLAHVISHAKDRHLARQAMDALVERYTRTLDTALLSLLESLLASEPDTAALVDAVRDLPRNDALQAHPAQKKRLLAAVDALLARLPMPSGPDDWHATWQREKLTTWLAEMRGADGN